MAEQAGSEPGSGTVGDPGGVDGVMEDLAADTRAAVRRHPRPGLAVRQVVLREHRDGGGTQLAVAVLEADGTLRITGHDQDPRVSAAFGPGSRPMNGTTSSRRPARNLVEALGGQAGDDVLRPARGRLPAARWAAQPRAQAPRGGSPQQLAQLTPAVR
jgi:hypothetical protein